MKYRFVLIAFYAIYSLVAAADSANRREYIADNGNLTIAIETPTNIISFGEMARITVSVINISTNSVAIDLSGIGLSFGNRTYDNDAYNLFYKDSSRVPDIKMFSRPSYFGAMSSLRIWVLQPNDCISMQFSRNPKLASGTFDMSIYYEPDLDDNKQMLTWLSMISVHIWHKELTTYKSPMIQIRTGNESIKWCLKTMNVATVSAAERSHAIECLGIMKVKQAVPSLYKILTNNIEYIYVRESALWAVREILAEEIVLSNKEYNNIKDNARELYGTMPYIDEAQLTTDERIAIRQARGKVMEKYDSERINEYIIGHYK